MIQRILNKCTTAVTVNLDGKDVTIQAGGLSSEYKKARFSYADQRLINACLLVPIESRDKLPMTGPNDLRKALPKEDMPADVSDRIEKVTDKKTKSKTDK